MDPLCLQPLGRQEQLDPDFHHPLLCVLELDCRGGDLPRQWHSLHGVLGLGPRRPDVAVDCEQGGHAPRLAHLRAYRQQHDLLRGGQPHGPQHGRHPLHGLCPPHRDLPRLYYRAWRDALGLGSDSERREALLHGASLRCRCDGHVLGRPPGRLGPRARHQGERRLRRRPDLFHGRPARALLRRRGRLVDAHRQRHDVPCAREAPAAQQAEWDQADDDAEHPPADVGLCLRAGQVHDRHQQPHREHVVGGGALHQQGCGPEYGGQRRADQRRPDPHRLQPQQGYVPGPVPRQVAVIRRAHGLRLLRLPLVLPQGPAPRAEHADERDPGQAPHGRAAPAPERAAGEPGHARPLPAGGGRGDGAAPRAPRAGR
mmetsp:Transcript_123969/g.386075  ORF Transcript_123969/g.386075 Transcript_123969/m.386075 type:complete len:371 (+) Transcript_123969:335-1447(+)